MTPLAAEYKRILEENGWTFEGDCPVCGGTAWKFSYNGHTLKVRKDKDRFTLKGRKTGTLSPMTIKSLLPTLEKYGLSTKQPA